MRFLITAGGTREYIDSVRFISNASSGRMGYALVRAALRAGHKVTLITGPTGLTPPSRAGIISIETAGEMFDAVRKHFARCDCLIMAAAVADYTPVRRGKTKIRKQDKMLSIELRPTRDILKWAGQRKRKNQIVVGFALDDRAVRARAEQKLKEKNLDMIIANSPVAIGASESSVQLKAAGGKWIRLRKAPKATIARKVLGFIENSGFE